LLNSIYVTHKKDTTPPKNPIKIKQKQKQKQKQNKTMEHKNKKKI
jgi:hypothetical protein